MASRMGTGSSPVVRYWASIMRRAGALPETYGGTKTAFGINLALEIAHEPIPGTRRLILRLLGHSGII